MTPRPSVDIDSLLSRDVSMDITHIESWPTLDGRNPVFESWLYRQRRNAIAFMEQEPEQYRRQRLERITRGSDVGWHFYWNAEQEQWVPRATKPGILRSETPPYRTIGALRMGTPRPSQTSEREEQDMTSTTRSARQARPKDQHYGVQRHAERRRLHWPRIIFGLLDLALWMGVVWGGLWLWGLCHGVK